VETRKLNVAFLLFLAVTAVAILVERGTMSWSKSAEPLTLAAREASRPKKAIGRNPRRGKLSDLKRGMGRIGRHRKALFLILPANRRILDSIFLKRPFNLEKVVERGELR